eukprot:TRINITY_DN15802_c0_g3_i1.p1 TRINITY_DN15802_c0_g3~~TRINITY_DN15802_c0_g3_i1.p1  ORF type:complete len:617 (-),score=72.75 TRINITY_DN15802_c0_g3_i1:432-2018(-)
MAIGCGTVGLTKPSMNFLVTLVSLAGNVFANWALDYFPPIFDSTKMKTRIFLYVMSGVGGVIGMILYLTKVDAAADAPLYLVCTYLFTGNVGWLAELVIWPSVGPTVAPPYTPSRPIWCFACIYCWALILLPCLPVHKVHVLNVAVDSIEFIGVFMLCIVATKMLVLQLQALVKRNSVVILALMCITLILAARFGHARKEVWVICLDSLACILADLHKKIPIIAVYSGLPKFYSLEIPAAASSVQAQPPMLVMPGTSNFLANTTGCLISMHVRIVPSRHNQVAFVDVPGSLVTTFPAPWLAENFPDLFPSPPDVGPQTLQVFLKDCNLSVQMQIMIVEDGIPILGLDLAYFLGPLLTFAPSGYPTPTMFCPKFQGSVPRDLTKLRALWNNCRVQVLLPDSDTPLWFQVDRCLTGDLVVGNKEVPDTGEWLLDSFNKRYPYRRSTMFATVRGNCHSLELITCSKTTESELAGWISLYYLVRRRLGRLLPCGIYEAQYLAPIRISAEHTGGGVNFGFFSRFWRSGFEKQD